LLPAPILSEYWKRGHAQRSAERRIEALKM